MFVTSADATIFLMDNMLEILESAENGTVEVCVGITDLPSGGLECDLLVKLTTMEQTAGIVVDHNASWRET